MEKKKIRANRDNDLKFRDGLDMEYNPDRNLNRDNKNIKDKNINEGTTKKKERLEYFTE